MMHFIFYPKRKSIPDKNPYFAYIAFNAPHDPRQAPKAYIDKYPLKRIKIPSNFLPMYPHKGQNSLQPQSKR